MQILNCDNLINSCCSNYGLARLLSIYNNIMGLIHIFVPIILIVMLTVNLAQLMMKPDDEKLPKKPLPKVIAAILVFFLPTIVNVVLGLLPNNFDLYGCLNAAKKAESIAKNNQTIYVSVNDEKKKQLIINPSEYEKGKKQTNNNTNNNKNNTNNNSNNNNNNNSNNNNNNNNSNNNSNNNNSNNSNNNSNNNNNNNNNSNNNSNNNNNSSNNNNSQSSSSNGKKPVLLIAGHSYPPYCKQYSDCRGTSSSSGYAEEDETRKLVKLIKSNLDSLGVNSDVANALLSGDYDKMNKSFFIESKNNSEAFRKYDWTRYGFVLEVHFNAIGSHNAKGTLLCKKSSSYSTKADNDIVKAVTSHTGHKHISDSIQTLNNVTYFTKRGIPITYLETEFYDNADAMRVYTSHMNEIARDIALAIKKHYG